MSSDKDYAKALWNISEITRLYYKGGEFNEKHAVDVVDMIEVELQKVGMGGITVVHAITLERADDIGDVVLSKNDASFGKLGLAGIINYRKTGSIFGDKNDN